MVVVVVWEGGYFPQIQHWFVTIFFLLSANKWQAKMGNRIIFPQSSYLLHQGPVFPGTLQSNDVPAHMVAVLCHLQQGTDAP